MFFKEVEESIVLFPSFLLDEPTQEIKGNSQYAEENTFIGIVPEIFKITRIEIYEQKENAKVSSSVVIIFYSQVK